jgi:threonine dehydratase
MPVGVPLPKLQATRDYGADVILRGNTVDEPLRAAARFAEETGAVLVHPFDHFDIVAGQGTLALEVFDQVPNVDTVLVPIGGGGLGSGVAGAIKLRALEAGRIVRVIGVQAANASAYLPSLEKGEAVEITTSPTIADGIAVSKPGALNFAMVRDLVDEVITVTDDQIAYSLLVLLERAKLVVEPAGAVGVAAILSGQVKPSGNTVVLLSGGNIDPMIMERIISHGLAASERYLRLRIPLPDRPGQLARISGIVAEANANVVEVLHTRHNNKAQFSQVQLELHIETRGPEHAESVLARLREEGFDPQVDF